MNTPRLLLSLSAAMIFGGFGPAAFAGESASPFTHGYSDSPVSWMPWGDAAFARAKKENRPIYVFIGSFLNELSRTTRLQSFANADTAAYFNAHFVCVLVDRDEHPDLAAATQQYLDQAKQLSGWPAHLWMTTDLKPYDGANYLSPAQEWGQPSLLQVATRAAEAWKLDSKGCNRVATAAVAALRRPKMPARDIDNAKLAAAQQTGAQDWRAKYDAAHGGFGAPPRYPQPELLRFLLKRNPADRDLALAALRALAAGALRDPVNGGFFRYITDAEGRIAYPQKTLSDQARLVLAYVDAQQLSADPVFAETIRGTLGYVLGHLAHPDGTFASAEDGTGDKPARDERAAADGHGLLLAALARAGEVLGDAHYLDAARDLGKTAQLQFIAPAGGVSHFAQGTGLASPADYAALALGFRALARAANDRDDDALADRLLARCDQVFLEPKEGIYAACPAEQPAGIFSRAPAFLLAETGPAPESLALLAGPRPETKHALARGLAQRIGDSDGASGDGLLALSSISY